MLLMRSGSGFKDIYLGVYPSIDKGQDFHPSLSGIDVSTFIWNGLTFVYLFSI